MYLLTKCEFLCPTHSEAKQHEILASGAQKGLLQGQARRMGDLCPPQPKLPKGFQQSAFIFFIIFHCSLLQDTEYHSTCYTVVSCCLFYTQ